MKVGLNIFEQDTKDMSDLHLNMKYNELISDLQVANAVMAVLLKLEIERRSAEQMQAAANDMMQGEN